VIPDTELPDFGADFSHDPCDLVTEHGWHRNDIVRGKQQIGVAQPRGFHVNQDLASDWQGDVYVLEFKSAAESIDYKCLH
jgi:hypothetical protein